MTGHCYPHWHLEHVRNPGQGGAPVQMRAAAAAGTRIRPAVLADAGALSNFYNAEVLPSLSRGGQQGGSVAAWAASPSAASDWAALLEPPKDQQPPAGHTLGHGPAGVTGRKWWVACDCNGVGVVGVVEVAMVTACPGTELLPDHPTNDGLGFGALCFFYYREGERTAGQRLLEAAEAHLRDRGAQRCFAFVTGACGCFSPRPCRQRDH